MLSRRSTRMRIFLTILVHQQEDRRSIGRRGNKIDGTKIMTMNKEITIVVIEIIIGMTEIVITIDRIDRIDRIDQRGTTIEEKIIRSDRERMIVKRDCTSKRKRIRRIMIETIDENYDYE